MFILGYANTKNVFYCLNGKCMKGFLWVSGGEVYPLQGKSVVDLSHTHKPSDPLLGTRTFGS